MRTSLILNHKGEAALLYGEPLDIDPEWVSIDVELGHIEFFDSGENSQLIKLDKISPSLYEKIRDQEKLLIIEVEDNDAEKPIKGKWVHLITAKQD